MRIAVIADIHGNSQALDAVLVDLDEQSIDATVSLGDNVGYGPEPERVVRTLIARNIISVCGNHELALTHDGYFRLLNPTCRHSLALTKELLSAASREWLAELPPVLVRDTIRFLHGCPPASPTEYLFEPSPPRLRRIFASYPEPLCFAGHTHLLNHFALSPAGDLSTTPLAIGCTSLNAGCRHLLVCGSVGQPRDDQDNRAKYGIWDDERSCLEVRAVAYDVETTVRLLHLKGFPEINARRLH
ncbi:metallophosphoesterase family protein [Desulfofustis limnaeus]|jgi:diadenosine tetraphosphatase ApaH/serine/threonine PP2A family protein phosphatase|uniref:Serine/threonine protein phosphatase n=1 Tax=Desulfofustis limnaeus TaxID=2740163 RepID=A0ABM7W736_9BACT|nr:metallophosphoesterase family protein [Desulfofustis limnaeus]MDX9896729.1 metallophosphoesterase family protein [Desulfofustis sp.]BDD86682.1 serine/threonine protein phosphatase [Desulfofustis limnaeus]